MKVIFLDFDGVLNGMHDFYDDYGRVKENEALQRHHKKQIGLILQKKINKSI